MALLSHKLLIPVLCVSLGACAFKKDDGPTEEQKKIADQVTKNLKDDQDASAIILKENNVTVTFEDSDPGYYDIVITWPEKVGTMEIFFDDELVDEVSGKNYFKKNINQNSKINLGLRAYANAAEGGRLLSQFTTEVKAPADYMILNSETLNNDREINVHRVYIRQDGQIVTDGHNLNITTDLLYIDSPLERSGVPTEGSHIVTYKNSNKSKRTSEIKINALKAIGKLTVALIGLNGADGKDGLVVAKEKGLEIPTAQAANGARGNNKKIQRGRTCAGRNKDGCDPQEPICLQQPTNGAPGADGVPGFDGANGSDGAATGNLFVEVTEKDEFSLSVYQRAGNGGRGGKGSPGQLGGNGGAPGDGGDPCGHASAGPNGKNGTDGKDGTDGAKGRLGDIITNFPKELTIEP